MLKHGLLKAHTPIHHCLTITLLMIFGTVSSTAQSKSLSDFIPDGYTLSVDYSGDINQDGLADSILFIKKVDESNVVLYEGDTKVDRNKRGMIVLLQTENGYTLIDQNLDCLPPENAGYVDAEYYTPELKADVYEGELEILFMNGQYGSDSYTFALNDNGFQLIQYYQDIGSRDGTSIAINFLTKKKRYLELEKNDDDEFDIVQETSEDIAVEGVIKLADIKNLYGFASNY